MLIPRNRKLCDAFSVIFSDENRRNKSKFVHVIFFLLENGDFLALASFSTTSVLQTQLIKIQIKRTDNLTFPHSRCSPRSECSSDVDVKPDSRRLFRSVAVKGNHVPRISTRATRIDRYRFRNRLSTNNSHRAS